MIVTNKIKIDLARRGMTEVFNAVQTDAYSRNVEITLLSDGVPWAVPDGSTILVSYLKPDGTKGIYDTLPDNSAAWSVSGDAGNILTVAIAPQVLTVAGQVHFTVAIQLGEAMINTFPIIIDVKEKPGFGGVSEDYVSLGGLLPAVTEADNGKFLGVVNGAWGVVDAPSGGTSATYTGEVEVE